MAVTTERRAPAAAEGRRRPLLRRGLSFEGKMLSPALIILALVSIFPFIYIIIMSFSLVRMIGGISFEWVGLDNWTRLCSPTARSGPAGSARSCTSSSPSASR
jgi:multiple sugar transport system permease protein